MKAARVPILFGLYIILLFSLPKAEAQEIITASRFFDQVSQQYGSWLDYTAQINIIQGKSHMRGTIYYRNPNKLHIIFTSPKDQVINNDSKTLICYLPKYNVGFVQSLKKSKRASLASLAHKQGLSLLKANYSIAYSEGPEPVALDENTPEKVVKLRLNSHSTRQFFKQLEISVSSAGLIRRISGVTASQGTVQFDFTNIRPNVGIPENLFDYNTPPTANVIYNFLFDPEG